MNTGSISMMPVVTTASVTSPSLPEAKGTGVDAESGSFDQLIQQFITSDEGQNISLEQLEALRSTLEEVDDSEVLGFLAMMQNQANWMPQTQSDQASLALFNQGLNPVINQEAQRPFELSRTDFGAAISEALGAAKEDIVPAGSLQKRTADLTNVAELPVQRLERNNLLTRESVFNSVLSSQLEQPVESLKSEHLSLLMKNSEVNQQLSALQTVEADAVQSTISRVTTAVSRSEFAAELRAQTTQQPMAQQMAPAMDKPGWTDAMGQRLMAMVSEGRNETHIRLDPPELGALAVRITAQEAGISVQFNSDQAQVRELLQTEASRLRSALEEQGMNLLDVNVGSDRGNDRSGNFSGARQDSYFVAEEDLDVMELSVPEYVQPLSNTLINTFA